MLSKYQGQQNSIFVATLIFFPNSHGVEEEIIFFYYCRKHVWFRNEIFRSQLFFFFCWNFRKKVFFFSSIFVRFFFGFFWQFVNVRDYRGAIKIKWLEEENKIRWNYTTCQCCLQKFPHHFGCTYLIRFLK